MQDQDLVVKRMFRAPGICDPCILYSGDARYKEFTRCQTRREVHRKNRIY